MRHIIYEEKQSDWQWTSHLSEGSLKENGIMLSKCQRKNITANPDSYT